MPKINDYSDLKIFDEKAILEESKEMLEKYFNKVEITEAEESFEKKAKNAFPLKQVILVK